MLSATARQYIIILLVLVSYSIASPLFASPEEDRAQFVEHYRESFPNLKLEDYADGVYAIDSIARQSWLAIEEFPPYEPAIEQGKKLFETAFANGGRYADCFPDRGIGIANTYPRWNKAAGEVLTLAKAINRCRVKNHEPALPYDKPEIIHLQVYMAYTSRSKPISIVIPKDDSRALAAYEQGKAFYYRRQGRLNFACATCHVQNAGKKLRAEILSASLGHTNNWPTYRLKWGEIGGLHRRFSECLSNIQAQTFPEQSLEFRNLEYYLSYMGNGVPVTGPSVRK